MKRKAIPWFILLAGILSLVCIFLYYLYSGPDIEKQYLRSFSDPSYRSTEHRYHRVRFEGMSRVEAVFAMPLYLIKYKRKRLHASHHDLLYFNANKKNLLHHHPSCLPDTSVLRIAMTGDIMWAGNLSSNYVSQKLLRYLSQFDIVTGNLETPMDPNRKVPSLLPDYEYYNASPALMTAFTSEPKRGNLFSVVSLANNHALDQGAEGLLRTMDELEKLGITTFGAQRKGSQEKKYMVVEHKGFKTGFYAATWGLNRTVAAEDLQKVQVNILPGIDAHSKRDPDLNEIREVLRNMEQDGIDFKIICLHWGFEYEVFPDPMIRKVGHRIIQAGADLIIGSHPHIIQPAEVIWLNDYQDSLPGSGSSIHPVRLSDSTGIPRKALILYSLGNFVTRMYTPMCRSGVIVSLSIPLHKQKNHPDWHLYDIQFVYNKVPFIPGKNHRLMLYEDYMAERMNRKGRKQRRIGDETHFMMKLLGN